MHVLIRYAKLLALFVKIGLLRQTAYRFHFFMMAIGKIARIGLLILFFQAIFLKVDRIGDWNFNQVLLLFATFHLVDYIMSITFQRNLAFHLPNRIRMGELDARMILPVNLLFMVSLEDIDMMDFFSFLPSLCFLGYVFYQLDNPVTLMQLFSYILLVVNALFLLFGVVPIIATVSFWATQSYGLARIFDNLLRICRYPLDIFEGFWMAVFVYVLPLILVAQLPSQALLNVLEPGALLFAFLITGVFLTGALVFWKVGLKNYMSASI